MVLIVFCYSDLLTSFSQYHLKYDSKLTRNILNNVILIIINSFNFEVLRLTNDNVTIRNNSKYSHN